VIIKKSFIFKVLENSTFNCYIALNYLKGASKIQRFKHNVMQAKLAGAERD